jgi:hypothetical protein
MDPPHRIRSASVSDAINLHSRHSFGHGRPAISAPHEPPRPSRRISPPPPHLSTLPHHGTQTASLRYAPNSRSIGSPYTRGRCHFPFLRCMTAQLGGRELMSAIDAKHFPSPKAKQEDVSPRATPRQSPSTKYWTPSDASSASITPNPSLERLRHSPDSDQVSSHFLFLNCRGTRAD